MNVEEARDFVREHKRAVLATMRSNGTPQMSPVAVEVDDDGLIIISTRETAMKTHNVRRDPRVWLAVLRADFFPPWGLIEGRASVLSLPEAMEPLVDYYRRVAGEHPDWDDYRQAMERDKRVLLRIEITKVGPERQG